MAKSDRWRPIKQAQGQLTGITDWKHEGEIVLQTEDGAIRDALLCPCGGTSWADTNPAYCMRCSAQLVNRELYPWEHGEALEPPPIGGKRPVLLQPLSRGSDDPSPLPIAAHLIFGSSVGGQLP